MLKLKLTKEQYNALTAPVKEHYKLDGEEAVLDVDGLEDTGALKRAKDHEKEQHGLTKGKLKETMDQLKELQTQMEELRAEKIRGGDKVAETEKAWQTKLTKREQELQAQIESANKALRSHMEDSVATALAAKLAGDNAELLLPHIQKRLRAEVGADGKAVTRVLDASGEVSAMTLAELEKEVSTSGRFSAVLVASKASGGGTPGARKGAGGAQTKTLKEMTATEEAQFARAHPEEYKNMIAAAEASA